MEFTDYVRLADFMRASGLTRQRIMKMCDNKELDYIKIAGSYFIHVKEVHNVEEHMPDPAPEGYLKVIDYANKYNYEARTVYHYTKNGKLPFIKVNDIIHVEDRLPDVSVYRKDHSPRKKRKSR